MAENINLHENGGAGQPPKKRRWLSRRNIIRTIVLIVFVLSLVIPTPYYLYQPGSADVLAPRVTVQGGHKTEKGSLMLTTVTSIKASNIWFLAYGLVAPHTQIEKDQDVTMGMSDAEYERLLKHMMDSSQQDATIAGLKAAGEKVSIVNHGVFVSFILPNSKANGVLQVGDIITKVDGHPISKSSDMIDYLTRNKKAGDSVTLTYMQDGQTKTATIPLINLPVGNQTTPNAPTKPGLGIEPDDEISLNTPRKVTINANDIGGPSAGLMFSLEIYNQIVPTDLTKGYKIAGTGTIDQNGNVGQIGGIEHKIVAAHNAGAEIFFCPADIQKTDSNTKDVIAAEKKDGYNIKIVPVKTMQDALHYLENLPPKGSGKGI